MPGNECTDSRDTGWLRFWAMLLLTSPENQLFSAPFSTLTFPVPKVRYVWLLWKESLQLDAETSTTPSDFVVEGTSLDLVLGKDDYNAIKHHFQAEEKMWIFLIVTIFQLTEYCPTVKLHQEIHFVCLLFSPCWVEIWQEPTSKIASEWNSRGTTVWDDNLHVYVYIYI